MKQKIKMKLECQQNQINQEKVIIQLKKELQLKERKRVLRHTLRLGSQFSDIRYFNKKK